MRPQGSTRSVASSTTASAEEGCRVCGEGGSARAFLDVLEETTLHIFAELVKKDVSET